MAGRDLRQFMLKNVGACRNYVKGQFWLWFLTTPQHVGKDDNAYTCAPGDTEGQKGMEADCLAMTLQADTQLVEVLTCQQVQPGWYLGAPARVR